MKTLILFISLLAFSLADSQIVMTCQPCSLGKCWKLNGGPFNNQFRTPLISCNSGSSYRYEQNFICNSNCSGCKIQTILYQNGFKEDFSSACSSSLDGFFYISPWEQQLANSGRNTTYNWCNCSTPQPQKPTQIVVKNSGNKFDITCGRCRFGLCLNIKGGSLDIMAPHQYQTCDAAYPLSAEFICSSKCSGCQLWVKNSFGRYQTVCSESSDGKQIIGVMNLMYQFNTGSEKYNWCNCPSREEIVAAQKKKNSEKIQTIKSNGSNSQISDLSSLNSAVSPITIAQGSTSNLQTNDQSQKGTVILNNSIKITISCGKCPQGLCETYNGGPFTNDVFPISQQVCGGQYPMSFTFECASKCTRGCDLTASSGGSTDEIHCQDSILATFVPKLLNERYSMKVGDNTLNTTYKWCNCQ